MYHTPEYQKQVRERVAQIISHSKRSERDISEAMGRDASYMNKIVNGKGNFSFENLLKFMDEMKITPAELFPTPLDEEPSRARPSDAASVGFLFDYFKSMSPNAQKTSLEILNSYIKLNR